MNYFESINLTEMSFYATVHTFYIDLCIVCKYHKDVINLEEVEKSFAHSEGKRRLEIKLTLIQICSYSLQSSVPHAKDWRPRCLDL
ncbi:uncharacterized protein LOC113329649 isoform X3 [Papaver somniferum]|uniref:uncharacterized protein LOC113329649 isoform X3 n=1 Tax=Papaver somniferum TaxID=3469 RepID=UPI000E6F5089|nr:uncharacterized protein LOC113329649 isoform X3 [Papaver somniferum]